MSSFNDSLWADSAFATHYLEGADHFIPERPYLFHVLRSYFRRFVARDDRPVRVCDLGCGDGALAAQVAAVNAPMLMTLVDGSGEMIAAARKRLGDRLDVRPVQRGFDELIRDPSDLGRQDFVISGFAIHHLRRADRQALFRVLYEQLDPGGRFLNIELVLASDEAHTEWHFVLWREWLAAHSRQHALADRYATIPDQARANPDNQYSPIEEQLNDLRTAGFQGVDCHYRNGLFAVYAGEKCGGAVRAGS